MKIKQGLPTRIIKLSMFDSLARIQSNERAKAKAENDGFTLVSSESTRLVYQMID